jgi:hypothetical protein
MTEIVNQAIKPRRWTQEDEAMLLALARIEKPAEIARRMGRSIDSVKNRMCVKGIVGYRTWTREQDAILKAAAAGTKVRELADRTGRSWMAVWQRCRKLGILSARKQWWTEREIQQLRSEAGRFEIGDLVKRLGRPLRGVESKLRELGLKPRGRCTAGRPALVTESRTRQREKAAPKSRAVRMEVSRLTWCGVCHAPVVNTPQGWAAHNARIGCSRKARTA